MDVTSDFGDVVVVLIASIDRAFGDRDSADVIQPEEKPLPRSKIQAILHLSDVLLRLVDDARLIFYVRAIRVRLNRLQQIGSAGVARVHERLREQLSVTPTQLEGLINPIIHLRGAESGWLDDTSGFTPAVIGDDLAVGRWSEICAYLASLSVDVAV